MMSVELQAGTAGRGREYMLYLLCRIRKYSYLKEITNYQFCHLATWTCCLFCKKQKQKLRQGSCTAVRVTDQTNIEQTAEYNSLKSSELVLRRNNAENSVDLIFLVDELLHLCACLSNLLMSGVRVCMCQTSGNAVLVLNFKGVCWMSLESKYRVLVSWYTKTRQGLEEQGKWWYFSPQTLPPVFVCLCHHVH